MPVTDNDKPIITAFSLIAAIMLAPVVVDTISALFPMLM